MSGIIEAVNKKWELNNTIIYFIIVVPDISVSKVSLIGITLEDR